ncbi:MAG: beta-ketoacyl-ACP synthase II [Candidatus Palauibacterales bacterium]|nr:beta-ketoacyl-ACP synthase II [Candidatus Palauibacterales bacterium]MDP2482184.1 beta-ketoacyl-ACP synthase II [Candidatus Palauibacterales bacterium]
MSDRRRVVVTGLGLITPVGLSVEETWEALLAGRSGGAPITQFDASDQSVRFACEVKGFDPELYMDRKEVRRADRFLQLALGAAQQAVEQAGGASIAESVPAERFGVIVGTGIGGLTTMETQHAKMLEQGPGRVSPFFIPMFIGDMSAGMISMKYGARGPNYSTMSACASSGHAVGAAFRSIRTGETDVMITGGSEATVTPLCIAGFASMKALSQRNDSPATASRPFDLTRDGFVLGEGAGILVLEAEEHAVARGATILGELAGFGQSADAYHITSPAPEGAGAQIAMRLALKDAGIQATDVDYINAHGTSTPANDAAETTAIKAVLGDRAREIIVGSTKSMTGHTLGAAGAIEAAVSLLVCARGVIPPTINYETPDPECDLDCGAGGPTRTSVRTALSNSFGFGGHNVTLAVRTWEAA